MAKTLLKPVSVYMTLAQHAAIEKVAKLDSRSVSNFLLVLAMNQAHELGLAPKWKQVELPEGAPKKGPTSE
jgi:uncharacterized protein (DUF1778 family)